MYHDFFLFLETKTYIFKINKSPYPIYIIASFLGVGGKLRPETSLLSLRALHTKRKVCFVFNLRSSWTDFLKRQN